MNRLWKMLVLIVILVLSDQLTKWVIQSSFSLGESIPIIDGFFNFTYVRNPGAAFGFLADAEDYIRRPLFLFLPVVACFWLTWLIWSVRKTNMLLCLAFSLILSGAIGNLIDRFTLDYVVDFLDFYYGRSHFPAFNIADSAISVGGFLIFLDFIFELRKKRQELRLKKLEELNKGN